jgi:hypothetical protein
MTGICAHPDKHCHPQQSEGSLHSAWEEGLRTSYTGPSRIKRAQDDKHDFVGMDE